MSTNLPIKSWAEEDRPREKLLLKGKAALSDAELIAILLGSGTADLSAVDLAKKILKTVNHNLDALARFTVHDLMKFKGIGEAKAISIVSTLELGRRRKEQVPEKKPKVSSSKDVYHLMRPILMDLSHEEFWIILLNRANQVIFKKAISTGGVAGTVADPKIIFKNALDHLASSIILVHNHPSGNINPSESDRQLTNKMKEAGRFLDIPVLDHIIFTDEKFFSFADEGLM